MFRQNFLLPLPVIIISGFLMTACSPTQIFQQLTRTNEEQAAEATLNQANLQTKRLEMLNAKRADYTFAAPLSPIQAGASGIIYAYSRSSRESATELAVDGFLPVPQAAYVGWLTNDSQDVYLKVGKLIMVEPERYQLEFKSDQNYSEFHSVIVSDEASPSAKPQHPLFASKLIEKSQGR